MSHCKEGRLRPPVVDWLRGRGMTPVYEVWLSRPCDVIGVEFAPRVGRLIPDMRQLWAIELKLDDAGGVLEQCVRNRHFIAASCAAMPAKRIAKMRPRTLMKFRSAGVGLISVGDSVELLIEPMPSVCEKAYEWKVERLRRTLWRRRNEWNPVPQTTQQMDLALAAIDSGDAREAT